MHIGLLMRIQQRPPRWLRMMCKDRQMGCFSLCKANIFCKSRRRAYCCLQLSNSKIHSRLSTLFSEVPCDRIRNSCSHGKLQLDHLHLMSFVWGCFVCLVVGLVFFFSPTKWVVKYWKRFSREVVKSPALEIFKTLLEMALSNLFKLYLLWVCVYGRGDLMTFKAFLESKWFYINLMSLSSSFPLRNIYQC